MYSDFMESPSTDCFSFNDQSSSFDMAEVNELSNQTNLEYIPEYIFDSYYSSVSRYNSSFELPEDCKNMSFSELFDQELFSTHDNKDCKITIKLEKEEEEEEEEESSSKSCYSIDNFHQETIDSYSLTQIEKNITSSSSLSKNFAPKRGINRSSIKTENCDVEHLMYNPFFDMEDQDVNQTSVEVQVPNVNLVEPDDVNTNIKQNIVGMEVKLCCSTEDSQNLIDNYGLVNIKSITPIMSTTSNSENSGIVITSTKSTKNYDDENLMYSSFRATESLGNDQMSVKVDTPIVKQPGHVLIEQNIVKTEIQSCHSNDMLINDKHYVIKSKEKVSPLLSKSSILKHEDINETSAKINNFNVNHIYNSFCETKSRELDQKPIKVETPVVKRKLEDDNGAVEQNIVKIETQPCYSADNPQRTICRVKVKNLKTLLSKSSDSKRRRIENTTKNSNTNYLENISNCETKTLGLDQKLTTVETSFVNCKPDEINNTFDKNIVKVEVKPYYSAGDFQNTINSRSLVRIKDKVTSLLPKNQNTSKISSKITKNIEVQTPVIKCESIDINDTIEQNIVKMEVQIDDKNLINDEKKKNISPMGMNFVNSHDTVVECQKVNIMNEDNIIIPSTNCLENNANSQNSNNKNECNVETEKKKISMEEYRAKRGIISLKSLENTKESQIELEATDNGNLKAIIEEFDRNTIEHFIGQKIKPEDVEQSTTSKKIDEFDELQEKRMKIIYIKKLLPSSFASEIAKIPSLMKGVSDEDTENENTSDDSIVSNDKSQKKSVETQYDNSGYLKNDDRFQKKSYQTKGYSFHRSSSRSDYSNKSSRSSSASSNSDDYYNRNRFDALPQSGQYVQNMRNIALRSREQKRVVYVGQIPIKYGKPYLYSRFQEFGTIQALTLHKKPDFRVYYAFVTYSERSEAECAINHGNDDKTQVQLDIRFGERKQTLAPYYDLDDEWLTDWYNYKQSVPVIRTPSPEKTSFEEELQEFSKLAQIKKLNQKSSQDS